MNQPNCVLSTYHESENIYSDSFCLNRFRTSCFAVGTKPGTCVGSSAANDERCFSRGSYACPRRFTAVLGLAILQRDLRPSAVHMTLGKFQPSKGLQESSWLVNETSWNDDLETGLKLNDDFEKYWNMTNVLRP